MKKLTIKLPTNYQNKFIAELDKFNLRQEEVKQEALRRKEEETRQTIIKMLTSGLLSDEQIAEFQNVPLSHVQETKRTL